MFKFFISYRRQDSRDIAARLDDRLVRHFGRESVFFDIDAIPPGVEFPKRLADELNRCDVLLAVIGDHWLDAAFDEEGPKKGQRRLDDPRDYVRIEIERALKRPGIRVVPLLVGQTHAMPAAAHLPDGLKSLADWQAATSSNLGPIFTTRWIDSSAGWNQNSSRPRKRNFSRMSRKRSTSPTKPRKWH